MCFRRILAAFTLACCAVFCIGNAQAAPKKWELTFTSVYQNKHYMWANCILPWLEEVKKATNGRLTIHYYAPGTLCPDADLYDAVVNGSIDMGCTMTTRNPGKFPYISAFDEPMIVPSASVGSVALWNLYKDTPEIQNEFRETKVLTMYTSVPMQVITTKSLRSIKDLQGKKMIITAAGSNDMAKELGATPLMMGWPDVYLSLERGMADGIFAPLAQVRSNKINEPCHFTYLANLRVSSMYIVMNKALWDSFPDDIKATLERMSGESLARAMGQSLDEGTIVDGKLMADAGHSFYVPTEVELAEWKKTLLPLQENWIKKMEEKGFTESRKIMERSIEYGQKYAKEIPERGYMGK